MSYSDRLAILMHEPSTDAGNDPSRLRRVELSRDEMMRQGAAIRETLGAEQPRAEQIARALAGRPLQRIVIVGCGDSLGIGIACRMAFERLLSVPTEAMQALDYALYGADATNARTLVIGISASGTTEAVHRGLALARAKGASTIAVSNKPVNPLQAVADFSLTVHATRNGWPTQSTTAAIALLCTLATCLSEQSGSSDADRLATFRADIAALPALVDRVTSELDEPTRILAERFAETSLLFFAGAGPHQAAAFFGASKIKELSPIHALHLPLEEYHHYRSQKLGDVLFLVAPDQASRERALDTALVGRESGGHTVALIPEGEDEIAALSQPLFLPAVRPELAPVVYSVPLHLFSYHFAKARFARSLGHVPASQPCAA